MSKIIVENNLRKVLPYYFNVQTYAKQRWEGRSLIDIYKSELGSSEDLTINDIKNGTLYVVANINKPDLKTTLKGDVLLTRKVESKDLICNSRHVHEPTVPWFQDEVSTVYEDEEILVVDKPSGVPTHPSGSYFHNSLSEIVKLQFNMESIWVCHRLDRVTSGVIILGKTKEAGIKFSTLLKNEKDKTKKTYLARVVGKFPDGRHEYNCPIFGVNMNGYLIPGNVDEVPTDSTTIFERIHYNESLNQSIVKCIPVTGKFHQIRIHLRNLGYPIANDVFYNPVSEYFIRRCLIEKELYGRLFAEHPEFAKFKTRLPTMDFINLKLLTDDNIIVQLAEIKRDYAMHLLQQKKSICDECKRPMFTEDYGRNSDIWLHALSFSYDKYNFETQLPQWANI
ncbi:RIB2 Bifunctional protein RIB2 [Candida maltosa Xu316]|uniref:Pseudouridine synthase RsuA/RluA-like domain-containing protein n=1 Tax=Candida maltosa (strain Xu316) TaxID=1245528 RepID=M3J0Z7_CANMX|nr:hypothetical protein G210_4289 [Candida maltosa Xu316]